MLYIQATYREDIGARTVKTTPSIGSDLQETIDEAKALSRKLECAIEFYFNDRLITVCGNGRVVIIDVEAFHAHPSCPENPHL